MGSVDLFMPSVSGYFSTSHLHTAPISESRTSPDRSKPSGRESVCRSEHGHTAHTSPPALDAGRVCVPARACLCLGTNIGGRGGAVTGRGRERGRGRGKRGKERTAKGREG